MKVLDVKYDDIDEAIERYAASEESEEEPDDGALIEDKDLGKDIIIVQGPAWRVTDKGLIFAEGVYCTHIEKLDAYDVDWSLTLIYDDVPENMFNPSNYLCWIMNLDTKDAIRQYLNRPIVYVNV